MPNVHTQLPFQPMPRNRLFSSWSNVTYIHIRRHSFGARCRPLTFTIQSCMAKVKVWLWSGWKRGGVWQASIGRAVQRGRSILCANMSLLALFYSTASNTSVHLGAVQCSFMRLAIFFLLGPHSKCTYHKEACVPRAFGRTMSCVALHCHSKHPPWRERGFLHCYSQWLSLRETPIRESW